MPQPTKKTPLICLLILLPALSHAAQTCKTNIPATTPTSQFTDNGNGTITDTKTGLMWKRCSEGQVWSNGGCARLGKGGAYYRWQVAMTRTQTLNKAGGFAGYADWRMPSVEELQSIVEKQCSAPAINLTVFPDTPSSAEFWSSSLPANYGYYAQSISFRNGKVQTSLNGHNLRLRLVR